MGAIKEVQEFWHSLPKYSIVKIIIYSISLLIAAFLIVVVWKAIDGDPMKVFGIEINQQETHRTTLTDTNNVKRNLSNAFIDTSKKPTTSQSPNKDKTISIQKHASIHIPKRAEFEVKKQDTAKKETKEDNSLKVDNSPGSINIAGKGNIVYLNADKKLTDVYMKSIYDYAENLRKLN